MRPTLAALLLAPLLALAGCASPLHETDDVRLWIEAEGLAQRRADRLAPELCAAAGVQVRLLNELLALEPEPVDVWVVTKRRAEVSGMTHHEGHYNPVTERIWLTVDLTLPDPVADCTPSLRHEVTHAVTHRALGFGPLTSPWLSEGFARWCELGVRDGRVVGARWRRLRPPHDGRGAIEELLGWSYVQTYDRPTERRLYDLAEQFMTYLIGFPAPPPGQPFLDRLEAIAELDDDELLAHADRFGEWLAADKASMGK